jgi:hypothetical protein
MNTVTRQIWAVVAAATLGFTLAGIFAGALLAGTRTPQGYTAQEWKAMQIRSEALNQKYHLGAYRTVSGNSAQAERALMLRSVALNRKYHLGRYAVVRGTQQSGFDWGDAGIGSAATLGLVLAAVGATAGARRFRSVEHGRAISRTS